MNKEEVLKRLEVQINQLNRQFEIIKQESGKIPKLELDRMLSDIRATYELFTVLNYLNTYSPSTEIPKPVQSPIKEMPEPAPIETPKVVIPEPEIVKPIQVKPSIPKEPAKTVADKNISEPEILADKFRKNKIEDLRKAIPLHEKFLFINELFEGENSHYNDFIDLINQQSTWPEAESIIFHAVEKHRWDTESTAFTKFSSIIQRKF